MSKTAQFCGQCGSRRPGIAMQSDRHPTTRTTGERKVVTVLFADIRDSTQLIEGLDPEAVMGALDPALNEMTKAVMRFGGVVNSVRGDGVMALFGVPASYEDHALRACLAALSMIDEVANLSSGRLTMRVGMDSGDVVVRATGSDASDFDVSGLIAHVASRVEQLADDNTARMTERTARLARGHIEVEPLGAVPIRGLSAPLGLFRLIAAAARPSWEARLSAYDLSQFVGRLDELASLSIAIEQAKLGFGQVIKVIAEGGYGKSRLVHEFLRQVPPDQWNVIRVSGISFASHSAYRVAAALLFGWMSFVEPDRVGALEERLERNLSLLGTLPTEHLAPLQSLLDLPVADASWLTLSAPIRRERIASALTALITLEAKLNPLVLLIEDFHWVDEASADVLTRLIGAAANAKILLIATSRPERSPSWSAPHCHTIPLPPLDAESAASLSRNLLGADASPRAIDLVLKQASGVPLYIEELVRSDLDVPRSPPRNDGAPNQDRLPISIHALVAARIDRLPSSQRRVLQIASVIGAEAPVVLLTTVAGVDATSMGEDLGALQQADFLFVLLGERTRYHFRHDVYQTVAYDTMLRAHRRKIHALVVAAMLEIHADQLPALAERLLYHALRGEQWLLAAEHALVAGDQAVIRGAWREAISIYEQAIEAISHLPHSDDGARLGIELRMRLRIALPGVADLPSIANHLAAAASLAASLGDRCQLTEIDTSRCLTLTQMGRLIEAISVGNRALLSALDLSDPPRLLNASFALAQAFWHAGRFEEAEQLIGYRLPELRTTLRTAQTGTTGTASVLAWVCLSRTHAVRGRYADANAAANEAFRIALETCKPYDRGYAHIGRGYAYLSAGLIRQAIPEFQSALTIASSGDIGIMVPTAQQYLGLAYALINQCEDALHLLTEALERTRSTNLVGMHICCLAGIGQTLLQMESRKQARAELLRGLCLARAHGYLPLSAWLLRLVGIAHWSGTGQVNPRSIRWFTAASVLAGRLGMEPEYRQAREWLSGCAPQGASANLMTPETLELQSIDQLGLLP